MNNKKKAYENILTAIEKNQEYLTDKYYSGALIWGLKNRIEIQKVCDIFEIYDLPEESSPNCITIEDHERVIMYCREESEVISWSDDGRQPSDEYVYKISFPSGAYIFGEFYLENIFQQFFSELKSYRPKYTDSRNHSLYFSPDNAKEVHDAYPEIFKKYEEMAGEEYKKIRAEKLRKELESLETRGERK